MTSTLSTARAILEAADPRELVEEDGVVMRGPGGAPQEGESVEEPRAPDRPG